MVHTTKVRLGSLRYSQHSIGSTFHNGLAVCYRNRPTGPLEVVDHDGCYYTLNNRHLYALRDGLGSDEKVAVTIVSKSASGFWDKFTTQSDGRHVHVRRRGACVKCANNAARRCDYHLCGACCMHSQCAHHRSSRNRHADTDTDTDTDTNTDTGTDTDTDTDKCRKCTNRAYPDCDYQLCGACCRHSGCTRHGTVPRCAKCRCTLRAVTPACDYGRCSTCCTHSRCARHGTVKECKECRCTLGGPPACDYQRCRECCGHADCLRHGSGPRCWGCNANTASWDCDDTLCRRCCRSSRCAKHGA